MFFSIIIPVYNRKHHIRRCLDSVLEQSFSNYEIIIVDDGSCDGTAEICDEYSSKYEKIRVVHQKNRGVSQARNAGIEMAMGEFIIFVDSDDYISPNYLLQIRKANEMYGKEFICCTSFKIHTEYNTQYFQRFQFKKGIVYTTVQGNEILYLLDSGLFHSVCNKAYRMSLIKENVIRFPGEIDLGEDMIFNLRYLDAQTEFKFLVLNKTFYEVWETKESLEHKFRNNYFTLMEKLLRIKIRYTNKWINEKRILLQGANIIPVWKLNCIDFCVEYYVVHRKDMNLVQVVRKISEIKHSSLYSECIKLYGKKNRLIGNTVYRTLRSELEKDYRVYIN